MYLNLLLIAILSMKSKIKNCDFPICKHCVYFIPSGDPYDSSLSLCRKFGEKNLVDGKIRYIFAQTARYDETYCGKKGMWFIPSLDR